jgi:starvation-inducible DNA-binding protein
MNPANALAYSDLRLEVAQILNFLLAEEYLLYATTRDFHGWVGGQQYRSLHPQFQAQYESVAQWIDDLAAHGRSAGVVVRTKWVELTRIARPATCPVLGLTAEQMLTELVARHEELIAQLRSDREACAKRFGAHDTAVFLTTLIGRHENAAAELRAQLECEDGVPWESSKRHEFELQKA